MNNSISTKKIAMTGLMAALVFVSYSIRIELTANTMIHVANVVCLLCAFLLGPVYGGLAAGIGSFFFDLTSKYVESAPYTLVFKFLMAFVCGVVAWSTSHKGENLMFNVLGGISGILTYQILYLSKNFLFDYYLYKLALEVAVGNGLTRLSASAINGVLAVLISVPLALTLKKALKRANINF